MLHQKDLLFRTGRQKAVYARAEFAGYHNARTVLSPASHAGGERGCQHAHLLPGLGAARLTQIYYFIL